MEFIGSHWWLWLIILLTGIIGGVAIHIYNAMTIVNGNANTNSVLSRMGFVFLFFLAALAGKVLLIISIIVNIIAYAKS